MKKLISRRLIRALTSFDVTEMTSAVGALHLIPGNASKAVSLDYWAHAASSIQRRRESAPITSSTLEGMGRTFFYPGSGIDDQNDSCPCLFTEEFIFEGRRFLVLPGGDTEVTSILKWVFGVLLDDPQINQDEHLTSEIRALALLLLTIQDRVAHNAGLTRGMPPGDDDRRREIEIPDEADLAKLSAACRFGRDELQEILNRSQAGEATLAALTVQAGDAALLYHSFEDGVLKRKPLLAANEEFIVPEPTAILPALLHHAVALANKHDSLNAIAKAIHQQAVSEVVQSAYVLGFAIQECALLDRGGCVSYFLGSCDTDKAVVILIVTDPLRNIKEGTRVHRWDVRRLQRRLDALKESIVRGLFSHAEHPESILVLTLVQSVASTIRANPFESRADYGHEFVMTVLDFGLVAITHPQDHLVFWRLARHAITVRERAEVIATSTLDELAMFEIYGWFFGAPYESRFVVLIKPGTALHFHIKRQRDYDPHGLPWFEDGRYVEGWHLSASDVPAFTPRPPVGTRVSLCVESVDVPFWITTKPDVSPHDHGSIGDFADAIAYWVWQARDVINRWSVRSGRQLSQMVLILEPFPPDLFARVQDGEVDPPTGNDDGAKLKWTIEPATGHIKLGVSLSFLFATSTKTNEAERILVTGLLESIRTVLFELNSKEAQPTEQELHEAVECIAPLGLKKRMTMISSYQADLAPGPLPSYRPLVETEVIAATGHVGERMLERGWQPGEVERSRQTAFINDFVQLLLDDLGSFLRMFRLDAILPGLVAQHESITDRVIHHELMLPVRLACFAHDPHLQNTAFNEILELTYTNMGCRVLIEHATAQPPAGIRLPSGETYDRLLALAHQVVELGALSDMLYYELIDATIELSPFGTLTIDRRGITEANTRFYREYSHGAFARVRRRGVEHWPNPVYVDDAAMEQVLQQQVDFNAALQAEFDFSLRDLGKFGRAVLNFGSSFESPVKIASITEFKEHIAQETQLPGVRIEALTSLLSLRPRASYLQSEAYPWRFNRALSYVRRPLLIASSAGMERVIWGNRHLARSLTFLLELCNGGRLKARSKTMNEWITTVRKEESAAFEEFVAQVIKRDPNIEIAKRIRKVDGQRLRDEANNDLGDIDIFVAIPSLSLIVLVECKQLELARTPAEIHSELVELFKGKGSKRSDVEKHMRRVAWVEENLDVLLQDNGLDKNLGWVVRPLVVSGIELRSHVFLKDSPMMVVGIERLETTPFSVFAAQEIL